MQKLHNITKNAYFFRIIKLPFILWLVNCQFEVPQSKVNVQNPECSKITHLVSEVDWVSEDQRNGKKGQFPYTYDDIQKKYVLLKINSNLGIKDSSPSKIRLKIKLERTYDSSLILELISTFTLAIIPSWADIKYTLSGSVIHENGKEELLKIVTQRSRIYHFFPILFVKGLVDYDKGLPESPDRIKRELIDSFLEANLKICNSEDS